MQRSCPICGSKSGQPMYRSDFSDGSLQTLWNCLCGMVYASESPEVDYAQRSKYAVPRSGGSGENPYEGERYDRTVQILDSYLHNPHRTILDIGCARGGLLQAFSRAGYVEAKGLDPALECVAACREKGLTASCGDLFELPQNRYDAVTLSQVLEHLWDVKLALRSVYKALKLGGIVYLEVPDAMNYAVNGTPYLAINREHVNHFSMSHLFTVVSAAGLQVLEAKTRTIPSPHGEVPSLYMVAQKMNLSLTDCMAGYLRHSQRELEILDCQLSAKILPWTEIVIWGYGEFCQTLLRTRALMEADIVQFVDRDQSKHGVVCNGLLVEAPQYLRKGFPILVASVVNRESILQDIERMALREPVITLEG